MTKHTPGPWIADGSTVHAENGSALYIAECQNVGVGERWSGTDYASDDHAKANACLIATAPQLLLALEDAEKIIREFAVAIPALSERVEAYSNLIAKARGES